MKYIEVKNIKINKRNIMVGILKIMFKNEWMKYVIVKFMFLSIFEWILIFRKENECLIFVSL